MGILYALTVVRPSSSKTKVGKIRERAFNLCIPGYWSELRLFSIISWSLIVDKGARVLIKKWSTSKVIPENYLRALVNGHHHLSGVSWLKWISSEQNHISLALLIFVHFKTFQYFITVKLGTSPWVSLLIRKPWFEKKEEEKRSNIYSILLQLLSYFNVNLEKLLKYLHKV